MQTTVQQEWELVKARLIDRGVSIEGLGWDIAEALFCTGIVVVGSIVRDNPLLSARSTARRLAIEARNRVERINQKAAAESE